jgi:hypothetical protein
LKTRLALFTALISVIAMSAAAGDNPAVAPKAAEVLGRVIDTIAAAPQVSFRAEVTVDEVAGTGQKLQRGGIVDIQVRRPDRVYADHDGDQFRRKFVYDGKTMTILDVGKNLYATFDAPPTVEEMLAFAKKKFNVVLPLGEVVVAKSDKLLANVESGLYLGLHRVGGVPCHHLAFTQPAVDWQVWVEDGPKPVLRKMVVTYKNQPQSPQFTALFRNWDFATPIPDNTFKLDLPRDASRIDFETPKDSGEVKK